jgi:hypothetical protein
MLRDTSFIVQIDESGAGVKRVELPTTLSVRQSCQSPVASSLA